MFDRLNKKIDDWIDKRATISVKKEWAKYYEQKRKSGGLSEFDRNQLARLKREIKELKSK